MINAHRGVVCRTATKDHTFASAQFRSTSDGFDVVIASMPGYGHSGKLTPTGWGPVRIARAWVTLMKRLGYTKFVAQGGGWGALVVDQMGVGVPPELLGIHTNMPASFQTTLTRRLLPERRRHRVSQPMST